MYLLEVIAKIVEGHVEYSEIVRRGFLFKLLLIIISSYLTPKSSILLARQTVPATLSPRISEFHEFMMHSLSVFQQDSC